MILGCWLKVSNEEYRSELKTPSSIIEYRAQLGHICRPNTPDGVEVTTAIAKWIPTFEDLFASSVLRPIEYQIVDGVGWEKVLQGLRDLDSGIATKKVAVRI